MSDPVTNVEIEDVLASIRRLVSEDSRPETPMQDLPGKLVLTPALRVSEPADGAETAPAATAEPVNPAMELAPQYIADDDYAEDTEEPQPLESADLEARFADMAEDDEMADVISVDAADTPVAAMPAEDAAPKFQAEAEPIATGAVDWEDAAAEEDAAAPDWQVDAAETGHDGVDMEADEDDAEDAIDAAAYLEEHQDTSDFDDLGEVDDDAAGILDEETLRQLVTDIVREELQGALGERITRNVRKLVRREIHRALTSHDLQ